MLKRTLAIFILTACSVMNLQLTEAASSNSTSNSDMYSTCCGKKKDKRHFSASSEEFLASCKRCKDKRIA